MPGKGTVGVQAVLVPASGVCDVKYGSVCVWKFAVCTAGFTKNKIF